MTGLAQALRELARTPILLVASDYDGTLAPLVNDPAEARPMREAVVAMQALAALPQTHAAVISGRALRTLAGMLDAGESIHLVGSHGGEFDLDFVRRIPPEALARRESLVQTLRELAATSPGFLVEEKPASVAFHFRNAEEGVARAAVEEILHGPSAWDGVTTHHGKMVVELGVVAVDKGAALERLRHRVGATATLFLGDDRTDEAAFLALAGPDVGVKVGPGESAAAWRIVDPVEVARLLAELAELRAEWLAGAAAPAIEAHSLLSDLRTAALVTPDCRITWLCAPRIDSPALFAELIGGREAGAFSVRPAGVHEAPVQAYDGATFTLRTSWPGVVVVDYLDCSRGRTQQRAGRVELVRAISGEADVEIRFAPRLDFGRVETRLVARPSGLEVEGALDPIVLHSPGVEWTLVDAGRHQEAHAVVPAASLPIVLELRHGTASLRDSSVTETARREGVNGFWEQWTSHLSLPAVRPDLVLRSALVLKALCHGPTGAIAAAPTTSLPEEMGGCRNWDYRYCWLRDAAIAARALVLLDSWSEALQFLDWLLGVLDETPSPERLHPLYTVTGRRLGPEAVLSELSGYRGSRPVRVSNAAAHQVQRDVFGPIVELVALLGDRGAPLSADHWRLTEAMVDAVSRGWREADHGIWEVRTARRHHVHSKVMSWLTVDRALRVSEQIQGRDRADWRALRAEIEQDVLARGWSESLGAFAGTYEGSDLDAAVLHVGLSGLLPPDDPRLAATVAAVDRGLRTGPVVRRYLHDDGLPGREGGFLLCTGWLVESLLLIGELARAQELFDAYCALAGPTGLLPEEHEPGVGGLGNHPQAYSHAALIQAAVSLAAATGAR